MIKMKQSPGKYKKKQRNKEKKRKLEDQVRISNTPLIGVPGRETGREETIEELIQEYFQVQKGHVALY